MVRIPWIYFVTEGEVMYPRHGLFICREARYAMLVLSFRSGKPEFKDVGPQFGVLVKTVMVRYMTVRITLDEIRSWELSKGKTIRFSIETNYGKERFRG